MNLAGLKTARRFFAGTASSYDRCVLLWTLGLDRWWKKKILEQIPARPGSLVDQACGTGILTLQMAGRFPGCRIIGIDLHREYLSLAFGKARALGLDNIHWVQGRAEDVILKEKYDAITSSYLAKYADLDLLVRGAGKMLKKGGVMVVHDFAYPRTRLLSSALGAYFLIMRTMGRRFFPQWEIVFSELEDFLRCSQWLPELISCLRRNGFGNIRSRYLSFGFAAIVSATNQG